MPFDGSVSQPGCGAEANLLRGVPGLAKPGSPSSQLFPPDDRGRQLRASVTRASIVLALLGLFCGSAVVMSEKTTTSTWCGTHPKHNVWPTLPASSHD